MNRCPSGNNREDRNHSSRPSKPYKPYILKGRGRIFGRSRDRNRYRREDSRPRRSSDSLRGRDRSWSRPPPHTFDRSPTTKKPRSNSKTVDKDKDRCFNCHQHGHFTRECPQKQRDLIRVAMLEIRSQTQDPLAWPELDLSSDSESEPVQPLN